MAWVNILIVGAAMAAIGALIGQTKGNQTQGAILGFLLGPIGWLITALSKDERPKCPECGGVVVSGARRCKNCGSRLPEPGPQPRLDREPESRPPPEPPEPLTPELKRRVRKALFAAGALVLAALLGSASMVAVHHYREARAAAEAEALDLATPTSGEVRIAGESEVVVCLENNDCLDLAARSPRLRQGLIERGRAFLVRGGVKAEVIDAVRMRRELKILEGEHAERTGWVWVSAIEGAESLQ